MTRRFRLLFLLGAWLGGAFPATAQTPPALEVAGPRAVLTGAPFELTIRVPAAPPAEQAYQIRTARGETLASGVFTGAEQTVRGLVVKERADLPLRVTVGTLSTTVDAVRFPGWVSVLPPVLAIALALLFREVIVSLFAGVWLGAFLWTGLNPMTSLLRVMDSFVLPALADADHAAIIIFSLLIGGMVGVIGRNGGTHGIVERITPFATSPRRGLLATFVQGLAIFFDDYANTLIVGNTMRPVTDRLRVSREKLAYVVDSTSAPVASIMFVSTWVGYEISLIADGLKSAAAGVAAQDPALSARLAETSAFNVFIDTIPYRFYPLLALVMVALVIWTGRDFGPMREAEARAASGRGVHRPGAALMTDTSADGLEPPEGAPLRWWNAAVPVLTVVFGVLFGLYYSGLQALGGGDHSLRELFGAANSFHVLLWASLLGCMVAILLTVSQRILSLQGAIEALLSGIRSMVLAIIILVLAWSLQNVTEVLGTAPYISGVLEGNIAGQLLPVLVFAVAAAVAFATGTSWGTMAILLPLVIPLAATLSLNTGLPADGNYTVLLGVISSVLAGSVFGDHCSPISDTTVMSSMASACDHLDHVRTQLPYAVLVATVGMLLGDIPTAYGLSPWISLAAGVTVLWLVLRTFGRPLAAEDAESGDETRPRARAAS